MHRRQRCAPDTTVSTEDSAASGVPPMSVAEGSQLTPGATLAWATASSASPEMADASRNSMPTEKDEKRATTLRERGTSVGTTTARIRAATTAGRDSHHTPSWRCSSEGSTPWYCGADPTSKSAMMTQSGRGPAG